MRPRFNGCTIKDTETECPLCTHRTTLGGNPILLKEVIELPDPDEWADAIEAGRLKDNNVVIGDIICISCDRGEGVFHNDCPTCKDIDPEGRGARYTGALCPDCEK